jgi:hypothetical protein
LPRISGRNAANVIRDERSIISTGNSCLPAGRDENLEDRDNSKGEGLQNSDSREKNV